MKPKYIFKSLTVPKIEKDRSKDRSKAVQSGLWMIWDIYRPVLVSVLPKIGKRPDWTRLSSTSHDIYSHSFPGWTISKPGCILKIVAALYGLRQSAYELYMLFFSLLSGLEMTCCDVDHGVFFGEWNESPDPSVSMPDDGSPLTLVVPIHVDNGLGTVADKQCYDHFM